MKNVKLSTGTTKSGGWKAVMIGRCEKFPNLRVATVEGQPHRGFESRALAAKFAKDRFASAEAVEKYAHGAGDGQFLSAAREKEMKVEHVPGLQPEKGANEDGERRAPVQKAAAARRLKIIDVPPGMSEAEAEAYANGTLPAPRLQPSPPSPLAQEPAAPVDSDKAKAARLAGIILHRYEAMRRYERAEADLRAADAELAGILGPKEAEGFLREMDQGSRG